MSKPMTLSKPGQPRETPTMPTMPPAGPDRIASLPWNGMRVGQARRCDCMNCSRTHAACDSPPTWST
jgi:hypothetical protein